MNVLLLCNGCATNGTRDEIISRSSQKHVETTLRPEIENILKPEIVNIRNNSTEMKEIFKKFEEKSAQKIDDNITSIPTLAKEGRPADPLSIRIRGLKESNKKSTCERMQEDSEMVSEVLSSLIDRKPPIMNVKRLGRYDSEKAKVIQNFKRPVLVTLANQWDKRLILSSLSKLRGRNDNLSISRDFSADEVRAEKELLKERYRLITEEGIPRNCLRIFDFKLQRKSNDNKWEEI